MESAQDEALSISTAMWVDEQDEPVETSPNSRFKRFGEQMDSVLHRKAYRAYDAETGRQVQWNVIALGRLSTDTRKAVMSRLKLLARLVHPGVMQCIDFWVNQHHRELVYTNEIVIRSTLKHHLNKIQRPKLRIVKGWCREILAAIDELHSQPELSSQLLKITPSTIYINANQNRVKLGIDALLLPLLYPTAPGPTAPQISDGIYTPSSDIYSFGMTLLQISTLKQPYRQCCNQHNMDKTIQEGSYPPEMEEIGNLDVKAIVESCIGEYTTRPTVPELLELEFWKPNQNLDKFPIGTAVENVMGGSNVVRTKKSMASTRAESVREVKKISEAVERVEKQTEFVFNWTYEDKVYEIKVPKSKQDKPQLFQKFLSTLSQRFEDREDNADNRTMFQNQTNLFKVSKTWKNISQQKQYVMEQTDFTCCNLDSLQSTRAAFDYMYQNYKMMITEPVSSPHTPNDQPLQHRLLMQRKQLQKLHKLQRQRLCQLRRGGAPRTTNTNPQTDTLNLQYGQTQTQQWNRFLISRNTEQMMNFNCSSILPTREVMMGEFSGIQPKQTDLLEFEKNQEKDIEVNFINFLTQKDYEEEEGKGVMGEGKLPTVAEEVPPDELNKSFSGPQGEADR